MFSDLSFRGQHYQIK